MDITVVIVNWNGGKLLEQCLNQLNRQTFAPKKILIMDNGSTDGSAEKATLFPGVQVYKLGKNIGFAAANNRALKICQTEFIALLNPDAFSDPDWLKNLFLSAQENPSYFSFGSRQVVDWRPNILDGLGDVYNISGLVWRNGYGRELRSSDLISGPIFSACACAVLYRAEALKELGGFDEDYFCYVEDMDLGFRLQLAGYKSWYVSDAVVRHVGSASTGGKPSDFSIYHGHRNLVWTFIKNMPGILFWLLLPLHLALNLASIVHFSAKGKFRVILHAKIDAIRGIPKMWQKRKQIQATRRVSNMDIWKILDKSLFIARRSKE